MHVSTFAKTIMEEKYSHTVEGVKEDWAAISRRVIKNVFRSVGITMRDRLAKDALRLMEERKFIPGGRYLYAAGLPMHMTNNCYMLHADDSREGWAELLQKASLALMCGGGVGINYSSIRHEGSRIRKTNGVATGPIALMQMINECGRGIMAGGTRRSALWAGLNWKHADIHKFINIKNWSQEVRALKEKDFNFPATLDCTNISVCLDDEFFEAFHDDEHEHHAMANTVYWATVERMLRTGEPGFSVDVQSNKNEVLRNPCCEVTSRDSDDVCCLGSINLGAIDDLDEFRLACEIGIQFLLAGTVYSDVPYSDVDKIRSKNRRLGLGLMGTAEWLLMRGKPYGPDEELGKWLAIYKKSGKIANRVADEWELSRPKKTRAIAPTGTIAIVAGTTGGIEPVLCAAYKRRYLKGKTWHYQYVVDPAAKRMVDNGIDPGAIEDAYALANNVERRVSFQAWVQEYVDHGISSTINLPSWGSEANNDSTVRGFGSMLIRYLPKLRGITCYPDGARGGQPLVPVPYKDAIASEGVEFSEVDACSITGGGSCGD